MKKTFRKSLTILCLALIFVVATALSVVTLIGKPITASAEQNLGTFNVDLSMSYNDLKNNGVADADNARLLYLEIEGGNTIPNTDGNTYNSVGDAVCVNGVAVNTTIIKFKDERCALILSAYAGTSYAIDLGCANVGDIITLDGDFTNATHGTFTVNKTSFIFDGFSWISEDTVAYSFDTSIRSAPSEDGFYVTMPKTDLSVGAWMSPLWDNQFILTRNGAHTAFRGALSKVDAGAWHVNFRNGSTGGFDKVVGSKAIEGDVVTLGGWFSDNEGKNFIKIANMQYELRDGVWTNVTPEITVYQDGVKVEGNVIIVLPDSDVTTLSATASSGEVNVIFEYGAIQDGKFDLRSGESISDYRVMCNVNQVLGDRTVYFSKDILLRVGFTDFVMEEGAAVRVNGDTVNGLRFTAEMLESTYKTLQTENAEYGMVIVPLDYITEGYELTSENLFGENAKYSEKAEAGSTHAVRKMLNLKGLVPADFDNDGKYEIRGAIKDILINNITREFVGVAYVKVGGEYIMASYYGDDMDNNARSIYYVSQKAIDANVHADALKVKYIDAFAKYLEDQGKTYNRTYTVNYITTIKGESTVETETFTAPLNSEIHLTAREIGGYKVSSASVINSKVYANKDLVFNFYYTEEGALITDSMAWYHPPLDNSNNYDNATNDSIAQTMKNAGFTTVLLGGAQSVEWDSDANVEAMGDIIDMFYRNGLKTVVSIGNWKNTPTKFHLDYVPDFSNHEGFAGFFAWDEPLPTDECLNTVAEYAQWYMSVYADKTTPFMVNLNPSYASFFNGNTTECVPDYGTYSEYIKAYCDIVLSKLNGTNIEKYLSVDTYPINSDGTLRENFLYDMAILKAYAVEYGAHMQIALQACGYASEDCEAPTEEQLRLQLYSALAFGADSLSWWAYTAANEIYDAPIDKDGNVTDVYKSIQSINNELATFGSLYKDYTWKGVLMSSPSSGFFGYGADAQYNAYEKVKESSVFQKYLLSANETKSFTSIKGSGSNYIVGVMEDGVGSEGFVVVNYSAIKDNMTLKLTFKAGESGNYLIFQNGKMTNVTIDDGGYTLTLKPGEGAFIVLAKTEHTVTFKNWDGTILQEETLSYGSIPEYKGATPVRERYVFKGWSPELGAIYKDTVYIATFDEVYQTYSNGQSLTQFNLNQAIQMSDLVNKAIHFEFKFTSQTGSFGFQVIGLEWNYITESVIIEKTASGLTAKIKDTGKICGRIVEVGNGWYAWELNKSEFTGDNAGTAPTIDCIYPRQSVEGSLCIDWTSMSVVDAYSSRYIAPKYETGDQINGGSNYALPTPISMSELSGNALRIEFKFITETGKFQFSLVQYSPWSAVTNVVTIEKTANGFTVTDSANVNKAFGKIVEVGDGWYAWEINASDLPSSAVSTIDYLVPRNTVEGTVYVDWYGMSIVDSFEVDPRLENATKYEEGQKLSLSIPDVSMLALKGKAIHVEFKFTTESGAFSFSLIQAEPWLNITGRTDVTKSGDNITSTNGRIVEIGNGWYAWEINASDFAGEGAKTANVLNNIYPRDPVQGTVYIDWNSISIVRAYEIYSTGDKINGGSNYALPTPISMSELSGNALRLEFKFVTETGKFQFSLVQYSPWSAATNVVTIEKTANGFTVTDSANVNKAFGRIVEVGDGWYAWEINASDLPSSAASIIDYIVPRNTVEGTVYVAWDGISIVKAY